MRRATATGIALSLIAISIAALLEGATERASVSPPEAIAAATRVVSEGFAPRDMILVTPPWERLAWHDLEGAGGNRTAHDPWPALWPYARPDPIELLAAQRLWVIGVDGRAAEVPALIAESSELLEEHKLPGGVSVGLFRVATLARLRTLTKDFETLRVRRIRPDGKVTRCAFRAGRHRCRREHWLDLQIAERDVAHADRRWVFCHPGPTGERLEIDWPALPRGRWLVIRAGFSLQAVRKDEGAPVTLTTLLDGAEIDRVVLPPQRYELERRLIHLPEGDGDALITFRVETDDNAWRELLVQADLVSDPPASVRRWATRVSEAPAP